MNCSKLAEPILVMFSGKIVYETPRIPLARGVWMTLTKALVLFR